MDDEQAEWEARFGGDPGPAEGASGAKPGQRQAVRRRLRILRLADLAAAPPRSYVLKGLMSPGEMSVWVGAPKCGKSFLMLHVAYGIAQARAVFGKRVRPVAVLYVAAEGEAGIAARVRALMKAHGDKANFALIAQPANLLHESGDLGDLIAAATEIGAGLIVIDTLSRVMAGGDENAPTDMGRFIANIAEIREKTGAHVAVVHHGTKHSDGRTPRGHSSLVGAADAVIEVTKTDDGSRTATVVMAKDDPDGAAMGFILQVVELGEDDDGDPITTCIVEEQDAPSRATGPKLTRAEKLALTFLSDLIAAQGNPLPPGPTFPTSTELRGAPEADWRAACESRRLSTADTPKDRSRVFRATFASLRDKALVGTADGIVWLISSTGLPP